MFQYLPFCLFQCSPRWITAAVAFFPLGRVILNQRCGIYMEHVWALELQAYKKVNKYLKEALTEIPNESLTVQFGFLKARSSSTVRARGKGSQYEMALYRAQLLGLDKRSQWECIST